MTTSFVRGVVLYLLLALANVAVGQELQEVANRGGLAPTVPQDPVWMQNIDQWVGTYLTQPLEQLLFFDITAPFGGSAGIPFIVAWLFFSSIVFTIRMRFINFRAFWHAIRLTRGDYDLPGDAGEVSHFQALSSALSATVGLGNIAGVAIAVGLGGPGAVFWMIVTGLLAMSSKFHECTLGMLYRQIGPDGKVSGGPMQFLYLGLKDMGLGPLGWGLAVLFSLLCIGASFGGGCSFQVAQSLRTMQPHLPILQAYPWAYGVLVAVLVGLVIIGGIRRIALIAERIVPAMCLLYLVMVVAVLVTYSDRVWPAVLTIFSEAFHWNGIYGGMIGTMVMGIQRASFSNEAGLGSAAIAHSAAKTQEPVSEGLVALLEPFIDTVVICTLTGIVIVVTGVYADPANASLIAGRDGAGLTSRAFGSVHFGMSYLLCAVVFLFAYSTMISWSYYGERCWSLLFGERTALVYRVLFLAAVVLGSIVTAKNVVSFSDSMILAMGLPNIVGGYLLSGQVRAALDDYWSRLLGGQIAPSPARGERPGPAGDK